MRKLAALALMLISVKTEATLRCSGSTRELITVDSGQAFVLPVEAVPGVLDYEVARAATWTLNHTETWNLGGTIATDRVRETSGAPTITERLYNTAAGGAYAIYYVVTATNAFDNSFHPCAQDFLVNVNPDPIFSRDAARVVIPVAGSLRGANDSRYETRLTLANRWDVPIGGRIVFHPSGKSASADDPSIRYTLDPNAVQTWDDVVVAIGTTGLGSIDVQPDSTPFGALMPEVRGQVVSVAPNGGSFGMDVPAISVNSSHYGAFWTSASPPSILIDDTNGKKRLALGVRTLSDAVTMEATLVASNGTIRSTVARDYPADYHEQRPLSEWFGALAQLNDRVVFFARHQSAPQVAGGVIVYLAETDNVTNDVSLLIPKQQDLFLSEPIVQCSLGCTLLTR